MLYRKLLSLKERILPIYENKENLATDFSKFLISQVGNVIASIQAAECLEILPLTNKQF